MTETAPGPQDKYSHKVDEVFIMKADGTLLNPDVVERAIENGVDVGEEFVAALAKTRELQNA